MTGVQALELRASVGVACSVSGAAAWFLAPRLQMDRARFRRNITVLFGLSRAGLFVLAFGLLHLAPRGDINMYMQEGAAGYAGRLIYRDFKSPHAPLDPYLLGGLLRLHYAPTTIILFSVLCDLLAFAVWMKLSARLADEVTERRAAFLMLFNPTSLLAVAIDGQMNAIIALALAGSVLAWKRGRNGLSGVVAAIPGVAVKFLVWIFAPSIFLASRRKLVWALGFLALTLPVYFSFAAIGANILGPLGAEGNHKTCNNLIYLAELVSGHSLGNRLPDILLAASWLAVVFLTARAMRRRAADEDAVLRVIPISMIAVMMCVQAFSKNTWDRYLVMTMYPLCFLAAGLSVADILIYSVWSVVNVVYGSYWATVTGIAAALDLHGPLLAGDHTARWMLVGELLQSGGNLFILVRAVQRLTSRGEPALAVAAQREGPGTFRPLNPDAEPMGL